VLPAILLRLELISARRAGARFEEAWPDAVKAAIANEGRGRANWIEVFSGTRGAWEAAYERDGQQPCWSALQSARI
jgi:hypothetical protein